jgi:prepilin signal peptidase PulO-like enzyme (type II secretory pathway)
MTTEPLKIKYAPTFPIIMLLCSAVILYVTLLIGPSVQTVTGLVSLFVGILMLTRPIAVLYPDRLETRNLLGMVVKTFKVADGAIRTQNNALYAGEKKLLQGWMINTKLEKITAYLSAHAPAAAVTSASAQ